MVLLCSSPLLLNLEEIIYTHPLFMSRVVSSRNFNQWMLMEALGFTVAAKIIIRTNETFESFSSKFKLITLIAYYIFIHLLLSEILNVGFILYFFLVQFIFELEYFHQQKIILLLHLVIHGIYFVQYLI